MNNRKVLVTIILSQFFCTSLWFAGNGVLSDLISNFNLNENALGPLTSSVQFGFISGTLVFAILSIADRFSPSKVFFVSALLAAFFNLGISLDNNDLIRLLVFRFLTGFFLAGIYPVGMKIAADYFDKGLGKSLGFLVGALVLGTALPHLLKELISGSPWQYVLYVTSALSTLGGLLMLSLVADGPYRKASQKLQLSAFFKVFKNKSFRSAAFGYFGHMWELYTFWAFVPVILSLFNFSYDSSLNVPLMSFCIIGVGALSCVLGAFWAHRKGNRFVAMTALSLSGLCCLISPIILSSCSAFLLLVFLFFWGMVVIADSPLLSTLVAQNAPVELKGTALTIVNCIGFSITIVSIQIFNSIISSLDFHYIFILLAVGPLFGLISLNSKAE